MHRGVVLWVDTADPPVALDGLPSWRGRVEVVLCALQLCAGVHPADKDDVVHTVPDRKRDDAVLADASGDELSDDSEERRRGAPTRRTAAGVALF